MRKVVVIEIESEADNRAIKMLFENVIHDNFRENFQISVRDKYE